MAVSGKRFLRLNREPGLEISRHALRRLWEYTGFYPSMGLARLIFYCSIHTRPGEVFLRGYRPGYYRRLAEGEQTWYFCFRIFGEDLMAVVAENKTADGFVWVTTYCG